MKRKLRFGLREKIVLLNSAVVVLVFLGIGIALRAVFVRDLMANVDGFLLGKAARSGPGGPGGPPRPGGPRGPNGFNAPGGGGFGGPGGRPPDWPSGPPPQGPNGGGLPPTSRDPLGLIIINGQGRVIMPRGRLAPYDLVGLKAALAGQTSFSNVIFNDEPIRVYSSPLPSAPPQGDDGQGKVLQVGYSLADVDRAVGTVDQVLILFVPIAICAAIALALLVTRLILWQVVQLAAAAERIDGANLDRRLPVTGDDEFARLSGAFNSMLSRIQESFQRQLRLYEIQKRFTADAAHELKSPLTVIQGNAELMLESPGLDQASQEAFSETLRESRAMSALVRDLLTLARADEGRLEFAPKQILAQEVLDSATARVRSRIRVDLDVVPPDLELWGDEDGLIRLISNLVENAAKATKPEGRIVISAACDGGWAEIQVRDFGTGIAPEHLAHLGERFYRIDAARTRDGGGTGLGLAICQGIVKAHGGSLTFASEVGKGTVVTVRLPMSAGR